MCCVGGSNLTIDSWRVEHVEHVEIDGKVLGVPIICSLGSIKESG